MIDVGHGGVGEYRQDAFARPGRVDRVLEPHFVGDVGDLMLVARGAGKFGRRRTDVDAGDQPALAEEVAGERRARCRASRR